MARCTTTDSNEVSIFFFATLKERAGADRATLKIPSKTTVLEFKALIRKAFPNLPEADSTMLVALNKDFAFDHEEIPEGAEIALFPPVSGGASPPTIFSITQDELDLNSVLTQITLPTTGAACFFSGMVRAVTRRGSPHETDYLEYEAYLEMAESKMHQVADEIRSQWPDVEGLAIIQRVGKLWPGTPTILIACTAAHRDSGVFEAARYGIDRLKQIVPIWKKEFTSQGKEWIEGDFVPTPDDS